jgi:mannose-1-phosphate guanylyltransferase
LQELTREITGAPIPKQYCRLLGTHSLLEATLTRSQHFASLTRTVVVVNRDHLVVARGQLEALPAGNLVVQPCNRDTGPGLLFALIHLGHRHPATTVAVFPSDHYVGDDRAFIAHVTRAAEVVAEFPDKVVILGIRPDRPESGYGYLTPAQPLPSLGPMGIAAFGVADFREKPTTDAARSLLLQGGLWNSFVMVFRLRRMLELLRRVAPREFAHMWQLAADPGRVLDVYRDLTPWNFSSQVLARITEHLVVLPVEDVHWSDWGTRESIERSLRALKKAPPWEAYRRPPAAA